MRRWRRNSQGSVHALAIKAQAPGRNYRAEMPRYRCTAEPRLKLARKIAQTPRRFHLCDGDCSGGGRSRLRTRVGLTLMPSPIRWGRPMPYWARFRLAAAVMVLARALPRSRASAQDMPSPFVQEVLVKSILVTLNDAVAADNFTVFHAKISKPFRDQFPPEKLRADLQGPDRQARRVRCGGGEHRSLPTRTPRSTTRACCA